MDILEEGALEKALNVEMKTPDRKQQCKTIYEVIEYDYSYGSKIKFSKEFLMKNKAEFNVHQFIPHHVKKNIQQIGLEYCLFSQNMKNEREVVVVVENSSK